MQLKSFDEMNAEQQFAYRMGYLAAKDDLVSRETHEKVRVHLHQVHQEAYAEYSIDCDYLAFEALRALGGTD